MDVLNAALKIILSGRHTQKEITEKLVKKGYDRNEAESAAEYYREKGYIDHNDYAKRYSHDAAVIGKKGPLRIRRELKEKGIEEEYIENAVLNLHFNLSENMSARFPQHTITYKEAQKIVRHFALKGFSLSDINEIMREKYIIKGGTDFD